MSKGIEQQGNLLGRDELLSVVQDAEAIINFDPDCILAMASSLPDPQEVKEHVELIKRGLRDGAKWSQNASDDDFIQDIEILNSEHDIVGKLMRLYLIEDAICDSFGAECFTENNGLYNITIEARFYALGWAKAVLTTTRKPAPKKSDHQHNLLSKEKLLAVLNEHASEKVEWTPELEEGLEYINHAKRGEFDGKEWAKKVSPEKLAWAVEFSSLEGDVTYKVMALYFNELFGDEVCESFEDDDAILIKAGDNVTPTVAAKAYAYGWITAVINAHLETLAKDTSSEK